MDDASALQEFLYRQIPITEAMGVEVQFPPDGSLALGAPLVRNHNHLGTAFGGSLSALLILAGYALLWRELNQPGLHIVVRDTGISYRRPVHEDLRVVCAHPGEEMLATFRDGLLRKGRARIRLEMKAEAAGQTAVEAWGVFVGVRA